MATIFRYFHVFSALFRQDVLQAAIRKISGYLFLCILSCAAEVTILSCVAVSVEPLLKAHTDALEALFASCKTLRLDSVKVRVAGGISPCVFFFRSKAGNSRTSFAM